jgi:hypothetical protein
MTRRARRSPRNVRPVHLSKIQLSVLRRRLAVGVAVLLGLFLPGVDGAGAHPGGASPYSEVQRVVNESFRGKSGRLFARFVSASSHDPGLAIFSQLFGADAVQRSGVYRVEQAGDARPFAFVALRSFADKQGERLGAYRLGYWPSERGLVEAAVYGNPAGFIEVTPDNQDLEVSEHFRLRDFLTHDQPTVWPKYLVLREGLVDKLELVIAEMEHSGIQVQRMRVMSGFRTPQYNATGGDTTGRDELSRHMFGDAADVFVDNDGDGRMDDLNGDGRIDYRDAQVIVAAVDRVEASFPSLVGGAGVYRATFVHGPFAHIDARGDRARWGLVR